MSIKRTNNVTLPFAVVNGVVSLDVTSTEEYRTLKAERDGLSQRVTDLIASNTELRKLTGCHVLEPVSTTTARTGGDTTDPNKPPTPPAGYRYVGFRRPRKGDWFENYPNDFMEAECDFWIVPYHIIEKLPVPKLSRLDMQVLGMSKAERHKQYAKQGGAHADDATDVRLPELPDGFRLESKTPQLHNHYGSITTDYYWIKPSHTYPCWSFGLSRGNISDRPVYVALPKE